MQMWIKKCNEEKPETHCLIGAKFKDIPQSPVTYVSHFGVSVVSFWAAPDVGNVAFCADAFTLASVGLGVLEVVFVATPFVGGALMACGALLILGLGVGGRKGSIKLVFETV